MVILIQTIKATKRSSQICNTVERSTKVPGKTKSKELVTYNISSVHHLMLSYPVNHFPTLFISEINKW